MLCETSLVCPPRLIHWADYDSFALSCATTDAGSIRRNDGFGLLGIKERVESMGGELTVQSALENGTAILVVLPLMAPSHA
jgi:glucose-6-phosphate-specific signal transduction histidine kinase